MIKSEKPAYVYLYFDKRDYRFYLGYHGGVLGEKYKGNGTYFKIEYKKRPSDFERKILKYGTKKEMIILEDRLLETREHQFGKRYYNVCRQWPLVTHTEEVKAKMRGRKHTEEAKAKMRAHIKTKEHCRNISLSRLGEKNPMYGRKHTEETKAKMRGRVKSEEEREKLRKGNKGKVRSEETRKRISENHADVSGKNNPMYGRTGEKSPHWCKPKSKEHKGKISQALMGNKNGLNNRSRWYNKGKKNSEESRAANA